MWIKSWRIPHCWSFDMACLQTVSCRGLLFRDRDSWWFLISFSPCSYVCMWSCEAIAYNQSLHDCLVFFVLCRLPSRTPMGKKWIWFVFTLPLFSVFFWVSWWHKVDSVSYETQTPECLYDMFLFFLCKHPYSSGYIAEFIENSGLVSNLIVCSLLNTHCRYIL